MSFLLSLPYFLVPSFVTVPFPLLSPLSFLFSLPYSRQFNEAARKRYFTNQNQAMYFYSMIADYFLGMWGGGVPKPFKYTEIQRHR